ncbi:MAG TPA: branched-chain amino acid ABC transporter ATP-binding protein/permease [Methylomirabilota bacterium]
MRTRLALGLALAGLALAPLAGRDYYTTLMVPFYGYALALLGLNLLFGYTGLLSFGHALFVALGAYTAGYLTSFGVLSLEVILVTAATVAAAVALPTGLLCVRYVKIYFGMLTLAFGMLFYSFLLKFYHVTGGDEGLRVLRPHLLGLALADFDKVAFLTGPFYYYALGLLILGSVVMWRLVHSPFGLCLRAVRDNPDKAASLGVAVRDYRLAAFVVAAVYGALGGVLIVVPTGLADPLLAYWTHSGNLVFMLLLGGFANFFGPILGAFVFIFLQDQVMSVTAYWRIVFGSILAMVVIFFPRGILSLGGGLDGPLPTLAGLRPASLPPPGGIARAKPALEAASQRPERSPNVAVGALLEAIDVRKRYGDVVALDGVSLRVEAGEFVSIIGPNGAGKTTLVNVLAGVMPPSAGRVHFKGADIAGIGPVALARLGMARSFQLVPIFSALTVAETLAVAVVARQRQGWRLLASLAGDARVWDEVREVADLFGFGGRLDRPARLLPQGDKKLLDVASAFALRPQVILLDEPTSGVSTRDKHAIMEVLVSAARRIGIQAIVQVEHDMDIVFGYSDRIVALHAGQVLAEGPPARIRADAAVVATVLGRRFA